MQFRLLENDFLPRGWSERFLRSAIEEGFAVWNRVPAELPRLAKPIRRLTFVLGAQGQDVRFDDAFAPPGALLEAGSLDESVVVATPHDLYAERVVFEPVGPARRSWWWPRATAGGAALMVSLTVIEKLRIGLVTRLGSAGGPPVPLEEGAIGTLKSVPSRRGLFGNRGTPR